MNCVSNIYSIFLKNCNIEFRINELETNMENEGSSFVESVVSIGECSMAFFLPQCAYC